MLDVHCPIKQRLLNQLKLVLMGLFAHFSYKETVKKERIVILRTRELYKVMILNTMMFFSTVHCQPSSSNSYTTITSWK